MKVESINVYNGHNLSYEVNLIFDDNGNVLPFNNGKGSHAHLWEQNPNGYLERKSHDKKNSYPIDLKYDLLIKAIEKFNKQKNKL